MAVLGAGKAGEALIAGVLSSGTDDTEKVTLFLDVGTNGEIVLGSREWLVTCACSAGPVWCSWTGVVVGAGNLRWAEPADGVGAAPRAGRAPSTLWRTDARCQPSPSRTQSGPSLRKPCGGCMRTGSRW